jgi:general stress protein 26
MAEEKLLKFRYGNHKGIFHYDVYDGAFVVLSKVDSGKIEYVKESGSIDVTLDVDSETYDVYSVEIIEEQEYVQKVYDHFLNTGNAWFKDGIEGLCVLRFYM